MKRREALEVFVRYRGDSPAVTGPSFGGRILHDVDHRKATIYNMELAYAVPLSMGVALSLPQERVYALEGDGSMIAGLASLTSVARYGPANLVILVFNNRSWATTGAQPTAAASGGGLTEIATAIGIRSAARVRDVGGLDSALRRAVDTEGPHFIEVEIEDEDVRTAGGAPAYPFDIVEAAITFRRSLEDRGLVPTIWAV